MDLDALLYHYFGTSEPESLDPDAIDAGVDRVGIAFGTEREAGRRFALWAVLHALGRAPEPRVAFKTPREREAAEMYARAAAFADRPAVD
jgi:hypothetical protein